MSDLDAVRRKLETFDAESDPEAFWELLTQEAVERVDGVFALVLLRDEEDELVVYSGPDLDPEELEDLDESPTFIAALRAFDEDAPAVDGDPAEASGDDTVFSVAVPIRIDGTIAGSLAVERYESGPFTDESIAALQALVTAFGPALIGFFE